MQNQLTVRMKTVIDEEPIEGHKKKTAKKEKCLAFIESLTHTGGFLNGVISVAPRK